MPKQKIPLLSEITQKEKIYRNRERWHQKGRGTQETQRSETRPTGSGLEFGKWSGLSQKHGESI